MSEPIGMSACIIAMNEADRIGECIDSVAFCDEVVVVDSHSTDTTREVAAAKGARVIERDWPGFSAQREFTLAVAKHDWVFVIDADERVSPELREQIEALRKQGFPGHAGWECARMSSYFGEWVRYGTWYPDRVLRLFDRRRARVMGNDPHDRIEIDGSPGRISADLLHHPYRDLGEHLATIERYTTTMAEGLVRRGRRVRVRNLVWNPSLRFFRFFFQKRGFLHGWRGLLLAYLAAHYVRLKYAKALILQREKKDA